MLIINITCNVMCDFSLLFNILFLHARGEQNTDNDTGLEWITGIFIFWAKIQVKGAFL